MSVRFQIACMIYLMAQAVLFGAGLVTIMVTPLQHNALIALPVMTVVSFIIAAPISWIIAPRLQARYWRARQTNGDFISG